MLIILLVVLVAAYFVFFSSEQKDLADDTTQSIIGMGADFIKGGIAAVNNEGNFSSEGNSESFCGGNFCVNVSAVG